MRGESQVCPIPSTVGRDHALGSEGSSHPTITPISPLYSLTSHPGKAQLEFSGFPVLLGGGSQGLTQHSPLGRVLEMALHGGRVKHQSSYAVMFTI